MSPELHVDVLIFGGGIAGLWTLARLRKEGYSCLLLESSALGSGQTIASQGIIHGGIKYALTGQASAASKAIAEMPAIWRSCLEGTGEIDLRGVKVLSERQYLWTTGGIGSRIAGFAASKVIRTSVDSVPTEHRPDWLKDAPRGVDVYAVDEPILDPKSLLESLALRCGDWIGRGGCDKHRDAPGLIRVGDGVGQIVGAWATLVSPRGASLGVRARATVLAAGRGNAMLLSPSDHESVSAERARMQLRPLQMVMVRAQHYRPALLPVYGHCVGMSDKPRVTITSQIDGAHGPVWYVGGEIAERGVGMSGIDLIAEAKHELAACLPWIDLTGTQWATLRVDRAEGGASGSRPDEPVVRAEGRSVVVWPTKLAFAPLAARRVLDALRDMGVEPSGLTAQNDVNSQQLARPTVATLPWQTTGVTWT